MKPLSFLFLIFLSACSIVQIEVRDKKAQGPQRTEIRKNQPEARPQAQKPEVKQETRTTNLRVSPPVGGRPSRTERGYYINTACDSFFRSVSSGRVLYAGDDIRGMGWVVMVESEDGYVYVYAKAGSSLVRRGEEVKRGQALGKVGRSGDGCGLLFEIRDQEGKPVDFELVL